MGLLNGGEALSQPDASKRLHFYSDSLLLVKQMRKEYKAKDPVIKNLMELALEMLGASSYEFVHVPRAENSEADRLAKLGAESGKRIPAGLVAEIRKKFSKE